MEVYIDKNMNDYYAKYIKYKTKYLEIKYGAGKRKKRKNKSVSASKTPVTPLHAPATPARAPATPVYALTTPQGTSLTKTPSSNLSISSMGAVTESPPKLEIVTNSLYMLIENKDDLVCLLSSCPSLSNYDITSRPTANMHLYINFKKRGDVSDFAHFSFHYPDESESDKKLNDMFEANTFHLRSDINRDIIFNLILDGEKLVLRSKMKEKNLIKKIDKSKYDELVKIKVCIEKILNMSDYKGKIINPTARKLFI